MKIILRRTAYLSVVIIASFAIYLVANPSVTTLSVDEIALADIPDEEWHVVCFAPEYHWLGETKFDVGPSACWREKEVQEGWTYITFYAVDGSCERTRVHASFLVHYGADYRCLTAEEVSGKSISVSEGVMHLR